MIPTHDRNGVIWFFWFRKNFIIAPLAQFLRESRSCRVKPIVSMPMVSTVASMSIDLFFRGEVEEFWSAIWGRILGVI